MIKYNVTEKTIEDVAIAISYAMFMQVNVGLEASVEELLASKQEMLSETELRRAVHVLETARLIRSRLPGRTN